MPPSATRARRCRSNRLPAIGNIAVAAVGRGARHATPQMPHRRCSPERPSSPRLRPWGTFPVAGSASTPSRLAMLLFLGCIGYVVENRASRSHVCVGGLGLGVRDRPADPAVDSAEAPAKGLSIAAHYDSMAEVAWSCCLGQLGVPAGSTPPAMARPRRFVLFDGKHWRWRFRKGRLRIRAAF